MSSGSKRSVRTAAIVGLALTAIALGVAPVFDALLLRGALVGAGFLVLAARLITLQLSYFREGDRKWTQEPLPVAPPRTRSAPQELRNPRFRAVWEHMDGVRRMMARREAEHLVREHETLGLTSDEQILFAGNRAAPLLWPIALISLAAIAASSLAAEIVTGWRAFALLGLGLAGMLYLVMTRDRVRYYLTSHRVLVRTRTSFGRDVRWTALRYSSVTDLESRVSLGGGRVCVTTGDERVADLRGLNRAQLGEIEAILGEHLPTDVRSTAG